MKTRNARARGENSRRSKQVKSARERAQFTPKAAAPRAGQTPQTIAAPRKRPAYRKSPRAERPVKWKKVPVVYSNLPGSKFIPIIVTPRWRLGRYEPRFVLHRPLPDEVESPIRYCTDPVSDDEMRGIMLAHGCNWRQRWEPPLVQVELHDGLPQRIAEKLAAERLESEYGGEVSVQPLIETERGWIYLYSTRYSLIVPNPHGRPPIFWNSYDLFYAEAVAMLEAHGQAKA